MRQLEFDAYFLSKLEHLSKVFISTNQSENERSARQQFPSILSQPTGVKLAFMEGGK